MVTCSQEERRRIGRFSANFLDYRDDAEVVALRQWMELWSLINDRAIRDDVPELPELQGFRGGEVVEPLVTLADLLGGDWPAAIRAAIVALDTDTSAPVDPTVAFMANVKAVLDEYRESHGQARHIPAVNLYDAWKALSEERRTPSRSASGWVPTRCRPGSPRSAGAWCGRTRSRSWPPETPSFRQPAPWIRPGGLPGVLTCTCGP